MTWTATKQSDPPYRESGAAARARMSHQPDQGTAAANHTAPLPFPVRIERAQRGALGGR
jgi:hypothetical protein